MQPSDQAAIPYLFVHKSQSGGVEPVTWPDSFDGILTDISIVSSGVGGNPVALVVDGDSNAFASAGGVEVGSSGIWLGEWHGFQAIPAGTELQLAVAGTDVVVTVSGWLLTPPTATLLPL